MKLIRRTTQFKRDVARMQRQGKDLEKLKVVLASLVSGEELAVRYRDHVLVGQYKGSRECHLEPRWLLIYEELMTRSSYPNGLAFGSVQVAATGDRGIGKSGGSRDLPHTAGSRRPNFWSSWRKSLGGGKRKWGIRKRTFSEVEEL